MTPADRIAWATRIATDAHRGQVRTDPRGDLPYIVHPLRVAALVGAHGGSPEAVAAAILHDVLEDTPVTGDSWPPAILAMVRGCTKRAEQDRLTCLANLHAAPPEAILVKLADRYDNLTAEADGPAYGRKKLVPESTRALIGMARQRGVGVALADAIEALIPGTTGP